MLTTLYKLLQIKDNIGEENVVTPRKKPHGRQLTNEDKEFNREINGARAAIENLNQRLKVCELLYFLVYIVEFFLEQFGFQLEV